MNKVLIGTPCMETLPIEYVNCLLQLKKPAGTEYMADSMSLVYIARERIACHALEGGFTHVMFIDSDMVFPPDLITKLIGYDKDIIGAMAFQRKPPYGPCFYKKLTLGRPGEITCEPLTEYGRGLYEIQGIGMACTLIKTDVFKTIYAQQGSESFAPISGYGEDMSFCLRARRAGLKIWVDTQTQAGHIGKLICTEDTWKKYNEVSA